MKLNNLWFLAFGCLLTSIALPTKSIAGPVPNEPANFCYGGCSAAQERIWQNFEAARFTANADPIVFSGECYHNYSYDPAKAHYGMFFLSEIDRTVHASGQFGFFFKENPYAQINVEQAIKKFPNHSEAKHGMATLEKSAFLDYSTPDTPLRYWMRTSEDGRTLYVVGQWGVFQRLFCEMRAQ